MWITGVYQTLALEFAPFGDQFLYTTEKFILDYVLQLCELAGIEG